MMRAVAVTLRVLNQARDGSSTKGGKVQKSNLYNLTPYTKVAAGFGTVIQAETPTLPRAAARRPAPAPHVGPRP